MLITRNIYNKLYKLDTLYQNKDTVIHIAIKITKSYPIWGPAWWLSGKESNANAGDAGLILELGRSPGGGNGTLLRYSCVGNLMDRGAWRATVHGVAKSWTQLSN